MTADEIEAAEGASAQAIGDLKDFTKRISLQAR
jgi:hypothetical protein